ncbi:MAG: hypothetical protein KF901_03420 [Myxococcales bacterium]|nr:hypothetical protein [Myxococcales bacterium]
MALRALRGLAPAAVLLLLLAACSDPACPDGTVRDPSAPPGGTARCAP